MKGSLLITTLGIIVAVGLLTMVFTANYSALATKGGSSNHSDKDKAQCDKDKGANASNKDKGANASNKDKGANASDKDKAQCDKDPAKH